MTYSELKDALYQVRNDELEKKGYLDALANIKDEYLTRINNGVTDYERERLQKTPDPDAAMIDKIYQADLKANAYMEKIRLIQERNEPYYKLIMALKGIGGVILSLFFLEGFSMRQVSKRLNYAEKYTWKLWREAIEDLTEVINEKAKNV